MKKYGEDVGATVSMLTMKCGMRPAAYFIGELESSHHFALAFDMYTHFTSPIRRYADVMVHRVLNAILDGKTKEQFEAEDMDDEDRIAEMEGDANDKTGGKGGPVLNITDLGEDDGGAAEYGINIAGRGGKVKKAHRVNVAKKKAQSGFGGEDERWGFQVDENGEVIGGEGEEGEFEPSGDGEDGESSQAQIALSNQCKKCNAKKKAAKDCQEELDRAWFCMLLRNIKEWWYRAAVVTDIDPIKVGGLAMSWGGGGREGAMCRRF